MNELELSIECSFSPQKTEKAKEAQIKEMKQKREQDEVKATKKFMKMEMPVLNLLKGNDALKQQLQQQSSNMNEDLRNYDSSLHKPNVESMSSVDHDSKGGFVKSMTNRDLDDMLRSARDGTNQKAGPRNADRPASGVTDKTKKQSVVDKISVPVRQTKTRYNYSNLKPALESKKSAQSASTLPQANLKK